MTEQPDVFELVLVDLAKRNDVGRETYGGTLRPFNGRDALWDAQVAGDASGEPGEILYIVSVDGNTLKVSKTRPA
mgnify:CR=1 FL=1